MSQQRRTAYEAGFKLKVVAFALETNNSVAARRFSVNEKQVRMWRKNQAALKKMPKHKKAARGLSVAFPELERQLHDWVLSQRQNGFIVTRIMIRIQALKLKKQLKIPESFVASVGWCTRFMKRADLCLRKRTKISQKLPQDLETKVESFQRFTINLRKKHDFELGQIGNMDETPLCFDLPANETVETKGAKTVLIKTTGHEKLRFTVVLCCLANGTRLPPVIIFKRKTLPKRAKFPSGVIVWAHPKGWMDEQGTLEWLDKVWNKRPGALLKKRSMLVWDSFRGHKTEAVANKLESINTSVSLIPGGLTSILQPLDVCLHKPFKDRLRTKWNNWMQTSHAPLTKGGNLKKVDIVTISEWVKDAWLSIPAEMIVKSFKKCCISNAMDGSEDDVLYEDRDEISEYDSEDELHPDVPLTETEFYELFGNSDSESEFDGFE